MRTTCLYLPGTYRTVCVVQDLVRNSIWFGVRPLPDDWYEFTVQAEDLPHLASLSLYFQVNPGGPVRRPGPDNPTHQFSSATRVRAHAHEQRPIDAERIRATALLIR